MKKKIADSTDLQDVMTLLCSMESLLNPLMFTFSDICMSEICRIDVNSGPLVDFPSSVNDNIYCKIVEFGREHCSNLIGFVTNIVVRRGEPVLPSDVLKIATLFSSICYAANHELDGLGNVLTFV